MSVSCDVISSLHRAQRELESLCHTLPHSIAKGCTMNSATLLPSPRSGYSALDEILSAARIPRGVLIEAWAPNSALALWFAMQWSKTTENEGGVSLWVDPFGEVQWDHLVRAGLNASRSIQLTVEEPQALTRALLRLLDKRMGDFVVLPPGLVAQNWLSGEAYSSDSSLRRSREAFSQALSALAYSARRTNSTVLILREVPSFEQTKPLACHIRLRLDPRPEKEQPDLVIEHLAAGETWIGRRLGL